MIGIGLFAIATGVTLGLVRIVRGKSLWSKSTLTKELLSETLASQTIFHKYPESGEILLPDRSAPVKVRYEYTFDAKLQSEMEQLFRQYRPDYGAFVAMDAKTGRILALVSFTQNPRVKDNLALRATFPSASVFKVVTAAAALETGQMSPQSVIAFNGRNHTLYKNHVLKDQVTRWTRYATLKDAFAKSINTVFGKIGANAGAESMRTYADRFGFNRKIRADFPIQEGVAPIPEDRWRLAESSSGFTRNNTMSPLQGALIAAAIANDGEMMEPYLVKRIEEILPQVAGRGLAAADEAGEPLYQGLPQSMAQAVDAPTAEEIRALMRETITRGTSRGSFRGFFKRGFADLDVGGKTGSLTGFEPRGKYDWFVGYAKTAQGDRRLAVAALTVHEKLWRVKSSYLARRAIETYFRDLRTTQKR